MGDCRGAVTHSCVFAAPCKRNPPDVDGSARFGLTAAPQAKCESSRLHDCSIVGRSLHAPLQRLCSTAAKWRARDAMWPAYYAVLARKPWLVDPPPPAQHMRAQLSNSHVL